MNNQLKKTFDSHNNATIIESKPNTNFGWCTFLQNKSGGVIQVSLRHTQIGENDNYYGFDFRIGSSVRSGVVAPRITASAPSSMAL